MAWWLMPAVTLGIALYAKGKRKAGKVRWIPKTKEDVKKLPAGLVLAQLIEYGDELPEPPQGHRWMPMTFMLSTTPLTPAEEVEIHVLEAMFSNGDGVGSFLTVQQMEQRPMPSVALQRGVEGMGSSYLTTQEVDSSPRLAGLLGVSNLGYFLTTQEMGTAPQLDQYAADI